MKRLLILFSALVFISVFSTVPGAAQAQQSGKVTTGDVKEETKEAAKTTGAYVDQKKDEYVRKLEAQYDELSRDINALKARAADETREARAEINEQIEELDRKKDAVGEDLSELKAATGRAWEDMKAGMDEAMDELAASYRRAKANF